VPTLVLPLNEALGIPHLHEAELENGIYHTGFSKSTSSPTRRSVSIDRSSASEGQVRGRLAAPFSLVVVALIGVSMTMSAQRHAFAQASGGTPARHAIRGMVLTVDAARRTVVVSHEDVPGLMTAMTMPFEVRTARELDGVVPGAVVTFTLVLAKDSGHIEGVRVVRYESVEQDPITARRLRLLREATGAAAKALSVGETVPDFTLTDQVRKRVSPSQFRGRVVALNFIYTSCVLPQFCYRLANHFGVVQKRFAARMGRELVLLTITFDPARDTPERLADYARQWSADPATWHFLTGRTEEIGRVCSLFGVDFFPSEGLFSHSSRTAIVDRQGRLVANLEGNQYTAAQLGDLVQTVLD
jgi:protein SCO1/2